MTALPTYFTDFLAKIRLQDDDIIELKDGHRTLRDLLAADETLGPIIVGTFLQGSYRRATAIRPENGKRSDVDVVVVTKLAREDYEDPGDALAVFVPFMEKHYEGEYTIQGRSIGIERELVDLDCVITAAPSVSEQGLLKSEVVMMDDTIEASPFLESFFKSMREAQWQTEPLWIPDRDAQCWTPTDPLEQIRWTREKNAACNGYYVNVVKAIKWWRRIKHTTPKYPKGYPVEHLIGQCCPDGIGSVAEGITLTLEGIASNYRTDVLLGCTPRLPDHGVSEHDVFKRVAPEDFATFYGQICEAAILAREAYDEKESAKSAELWKRLFGDDFPDPPPGGGDGGSESPGGGFTPRTRESRIGGGRFGRWTSDRAASI